MRLPNSLYFGWSRANPPDRRRYEIPIGTGDFFLLHREGDDLVWPRYSLIDRLVHELTDPDGPRFAVITGLRKTLGFTNKQIYNLQGDILKRLGERLSYKIVPNGGEKLDGVFTSKQLHFDFWPHSYPIISLAYGPFQGIRPGEGIPRLGDFKQWVQDTSRLKLAWLMKRWPDKENFKTLYTHFHDQELEKQNKAMTRNHAIELDHLDYEADLPVLFINNDIATGVAHGATRVSWLSDEKSRPILRQYVVPKPRND